MSSNLKQEIVTKLCYTELVYNRINKKLNTSLDKVGIEKLLVALISETKEDQIKKIGKNYYATHNVRKIRVTINSKTFRVITVDRLNV